MFRTGVVLTVLTALFLAWDGVIKLMMIQPVIDSFRSLGYPEGIGFGIGVLELACLALYVIPRTSVFGAVLLTGYLGGATATHLRLGNPFFTHTFFPFYVGLLLWAGLFLRDARLRTLFPLRTERAV
jgi:hypothetical protein